MKKKIKQNKPVNHHYLAESYQAGFENADNRLYRLKKEYTHNIIPCTSGQVFYIKHLHTMELGAEKTVMIENYFSAIEGEFKKMITLLQKNFHEPQIFSQIIEMDDSQRILKIAIATQYWRLPKNTEPALKQAPKLRQLYNESSALIQELIPISDMRMLKRFEKYPDRDNALKVIQFILLPLFTFKIDKPELKIQAIRLNAPEELITSDNPVVFTEKNELFEFRSFQFPLTKNILLVGTMDNPNNIDINNINLAIAKQTNKIMISGSKEILTKIKEKIYIEAQNK